MERPIKTKHNRKGWLLHAFALLFIPIFIGLGLWQLERYEEKRALEARYESRLSQSPVAITELNHKQAENLMFTAVEVQGQLIKTPALLLENRYLGGQLGFELLRPVQVPSQQELAVLVNFGWIKSPPTRQTLPVLPRLPKDITLRGTLVSPETNPLAGDSTVPFEDPIIRVIDIDLAEISSRSGLSLLPYVVRIDPADPLALKTDWRITNTRSQKHFGYAVQWFLMALALAVLWFLAWSQQSRRSRE